MSTITGAAAAVKHKKPVMTTRKRNLIAGLLFTSPAIVGFLLFSIGPMIASLILSFTDYSVVKETQFVGLANYSRLLTGEDPFFYQSVKVTIYFVLLNVPAGIIVSFLLAVLLNQKVKGWQFFRIIFYMPTIVPMVATTMIWMWLMNPDFGLLNTVLQSAGLPTSKWVFGQDTVIPSLVMMAVWSTGSIMVVFLAGLQGIPGELYEAIEVDGGNVFAKFFHITLPLMTPIIFFNTVMHMISSIQAFLQAYIITQGGPNNASLFYVYYLFREAFEFQNLGGAFAISWLLFGFVAVCTFIAFKTSKKWVFYGGDN
jgi:multiple sugar transport system permease protein